MCRRLQPWLLERFNRTYEVSVASQKRRLLSAIVGQVLEIGPGTGVNLKYYGKDVSWTAAEPNVFMHSRLLRAASAAEIEAEVSTAAAEKLTYPSESFDAVVATLVLCSVRDVNAALCETFRVLRPGGRFVFIEHVAAPPGTRTRAVQRLAAPLFGLLADCRPCQETGALIASVFGESNAENFVVPFPVVGPHLAGSATKRLK